MFFLLPPDEAVIARILREQAPLPFSYPEVGATRSAAPAGYNVDDYGLALGQGEATFQRACAALDAWVMYPPWIHIFPAGVPASEGHVFASLIEHLGFYSLNSGRVIYTIDERGGAVERRGFAFGTLPGHEEMGEERFCVSWARSSDEVRYDVLAFSRPRGLLPRLGAPVGRMLQRRFIRESRVAMLQAARG